MTGPPGGPRSEPGFLMETRTSTGRDELSGQPGVGNGLAEAPEPMRLLERCEEQDRGFSAGGGQLGRHLHLRQPQPRAAPPGVWLRLLGSKSGGEGPGQGETKSQWQTGSRGSHQAWWLLYLGCSPGAPTLSRPGSESNGKPQQWSWLAALLRQPRLTLAQLGGFLLFRPPLSHSF